MPVFYIILARKISKIPEFLYFYRKSIQILESYMIFCQKNAPILNNNCPKNIFPNFRGGGARAPCSPVFYAYVRAVTESRK